MQKIAIVTDTDASLPADLVKKYSIYEVPITVHFGDEVLRTGIDLDDERLFQRIDREGKLPTTSAPSPGMFVQAYEQAFSDGADAVLCFTVSGEISATYNAALTGANEFRGKTIQVVDTKSLTLGQGFMVLEAAEALAAGASLEEAVKRAGSVRERTHLYAALATLKYLAMSGRVSHLAAGFATLLNIKPILTISNGKLEMLEKVRTRSKAWDRCLQLTREAAAGKAIQRMGIVHVSARKEAEEFRALLQAELPCPPEILMADLTPGLSVHSGSGMVGVAIVTG